MNSVGSIIASMDRKGVRLTLDKGQLRYRAPKGLLTFEDLEILQAMKPQIVEFLQHSAPAAEGHPCLEPRTTAELVSFTPTQRWWWAFVEPLGLAGKIRFCEMRNMAAAIRFRGKLNIAALHESIKELVRRHEPLRTRIVVSDSSPAMEIHEARDCDLDVVDLTTPDRGVVEAEARRLVEEVVYDLAGPPFAVRLLKLAAEDHVLVLAMGHIISDTYSVKVLFRDMTAFYGQACRGVPLLLPKLPIQFADYALWLHKTDRWWGESRAPYWTQRLRGATGSCFPADADLARTARYKNIQVGFRLTESLVSGLRELARRATATLPMVVLAAYVTLLMRWQQKNDLVIKFVINGRDRPELNNLIGFFSTPLHLRIQVGEDDTFLEVVRRVTQEYYAAYDHRDFGRVSLMWKGSGIVLSTAVNWIPLQSVGATSAGRSVREESRDQLEIETFPYTPYAPYIAGRWDYDARAVPADPWLILREETAGVSGTMAYRSDRFSPQSMDRFLTHLRLFMERFLEQPLTRVSEMSYG